MAKDKGENDGKDQEDRRPTEKGDLKKLRKLIKGARVAMLTTVAPDGTLRSRPMATLKAPFEGDLWFFTRASAPKADEIRDNDHVNVSFSDGDDNRYLSISGTASLVRDTERLEQLWSGRLKNWFPDGKKDPDLALLRVRVDRADYWDAKTAAMVHLGGLVKSSLGGDPTVENRKSDTPARPPPDPPPEPARRVSPADALPERVRVDGPPAPSGLPVGDLVDREVQVRRARGGVARRPDVAQDVAAPHRLPFGEAGGQPVQVRVVEAVAAGLVELVHRDAAGAAVAQPAHRARRPPPPPPCLAAP